MSAIPKGSRLLPNDAENPDARPGAYYVSVVDGPRFLLLAGPFPTHAQALESVAPAEGLVRELYAGDPKLPWYGFGTCRVELPTTSVGALNDRLGIDRRVYGSIIPDTAIPTGPTI